MVLKNLFKTEEEIKGTLIGNIFADGSDIVSNLIDRACNELEGDELADFLQGIIGQIREVAEERNLFVESKEQKDESKNCEQEEEPVKEGFSKQSFNEVFTKYYKDTISKTESFETTKVLKNDKAIKVEGKLNLTNGNSKDITLTLNKKRIITISIQIIIPISLKNIILR